MGNRPGPVSESQRIVSLDVLRGFAVLGILVMNIGSFSMTSATYFDPTAYGDLTGANGWVYRITHLLGDLKFMAIFSMLFGAGIILMTDRSESRGKSPTGLHYRRMFWLIVFGLLHAHLLWYGDILYWYGMCGLVVYLFRKMRPQKLIMWGLVSIGMTSALMFTMGLTIEFWPPEAVQEVVADLKPSAEATAAEVATYQSGWLEQMKKRVPTSLQMQTSTFSSGPSGAWPGLCSWAWRFSNLVSLVRSKRQRRTKG